MDFFCHETAVVDPGALIGQDTRIWHFCHVAAGARIGRRCVLGQNVYVAPTVVVGDDVRIQNNVSLYDGVTLEDAVFLGPSAVFTNVTLPRAEFPRKHEYRPTLVRHGASIGANATILCGHTIGRYAMVGAGRGGHQGRARSCPGHGRARVSGRLGLLLRRPPHPRW